MLRNLLEDRFRLITHSEIRETPAYALIVGKRGIKLPTVDDSDQCAAEALLSRGQSVVVASPCGRMRISASAAGMLMEGKRVPISELVRVLAVSLDRPVLDKTNLSGLFDVRLEFADDVPTSSPHESEGAPVFVAIQEQLGLRLEAAKAKIRFLVIDQIERQTAKP
jgi:uncharacterized protein (TIGR03435 family)